MSRVRVVRNAGFSVAQVLLSGLALLVMYRLLMARLSIAEIGLWSLVVGSTNVARLSEMGLGAGTLRFVASDMHVGDRASAARTSAMAALAVAAMVGVLALIARPFLLHYLIAASPAPMHTAVEPLVDAALAGVCLSAVSNVFLGTVDACQRMDLRSSLQIAGSFVQLGLTWLLLPRLGLAGLGLVQAAQAGFMALCGAILAWRLIGVPLRAFVGFDRTRLGQLFRYGGGLQLIGLSQLLFEPLIKVLLTHFSGLTLTGYFDMANRIVMQFRSVVVAANQALVPHVAARSGSTGFDRGQIRTIYREVLGLQLVTVLPYFACVAASMPLALTVWKGRFDPVFLAVALAQIVGWTVNLVCAPAYLLNVATGNLRGNIASHVAIAGLVVVLGLGLGQLAGGRGVIAAGVLALALGAAVVLFEFHRRTRIELAAIVTAARFIDVAMVVLALLVASQFAVGRIEPTWSALLVLPAAVGILAALRIWRDPAAGRLRREVLGAFGRSRVAV